MQTESYRSALRPADSGNKGTWQKIRSCYKRLHEASVCHNGVAWENLRQREDGSIFAVTLALQLLAGSIFFLTERTKQSKP